jgi:hypothetical protein
MTTLLQQIALDAAAITADADAGFSEEVSYTPSGETASAINVIMNRSNFASEFQTEGENWAKSGSVYILREDVDQPGRGDQFTADDGIWCITAVSGQNIAGTTCVIMLKSRITNGHIHR